jgi:hypothetical protein
MTGLAGTVTCVTQAVPGLAPVDPERSRQHYAAWETVHAIQTSRFGINA